METQFSIIVIGNGLIGSAAARYLAGESDAVALLGPPEPSDWENHDGVFSSHYDEGRITRIMDSNPHWAEFAHRSIDEYPNIEKESGIRFFILWGVFRVLKQGCLEINGIHSKMKLPDIKLTQKSWEKTNSKNSFLLSFW